jgi:hypothetical protein
VNSPVLTPAEELGLSGVGLAGRLNKAVASFSDSTLVAVIGRLREEALRMHLVYLHEGRPEPIRILPRPLLVLPDQLAYIHSASLTIINALKRLPELYLSEPRVRDILRLPPEEEVWLRECSTPAARENDPVFGRLDAVVDFSSPMWKNSLLFMEPNLGGVGGIHLVPTCDRIMVDVVLPLIQQKDEQLLFERVHDIRELLMQEMFDHLDILGRPRRNICFIEPTQADTGPDEQEALAQYFHDRHGLKVMHADPGDLTLREGEVYFRDDRVELGYRDYEVRDLLELQRQGIDVGPVKTLFRQNRIISSITGDLDQKSCWEILTDPDLTHVYFRADERTVFRRHILWTRLLSDRRTLLPDGRTGDLLEYVGHERESLVLKPNRGYGGSGVALGLSMSQAQWEVAIDRGLADTERWVVQRLATIPVQEFPVLGSDGVIDSAPFYLVMGFAATAYGLSILARASQKQVVKVAQRGGMCAVAVSRSPVQAVR